VGSRRFGRTLKIGPRDVAGLAASMQWRMTQERSAEALALDRARIPFAATLPDDQRSSYEAMEDFPHGFVEWLRWWEFVNRESGERQRFIGDGRDLWPAQRDAAERMIAHPWLFLLKAGKLGFTELECAWDGYVMRFAQARARVNAFSKDKTAAQELVGVVRHGLLHLPEWMGVRLVDEVAGGDTSQSIKVQPLNTMDGTDIRHLQAYAASTNPSIDVSATHAHVDELSHMTHGKDVWGSVSTTVAPHGTLHIVSRGAGDDKYSADLWRDAMLGRDPTTFELLPGRTPNGRLVPFFANWRGRPDRDDEWYALEAGTRSHQRMLHFAPTTPEDALAGDDTAIYIPEEVWNACEDTTMPPLMPGDRDAVVMAVDAGVTSDTFAIVLVSRHPDVCPCGRSKEDPAIRAAVVWKAPVDGAIDYGPLGHAQASPSDWIQFACFGGCLAGHPNKSRRELSTPPDGEQCDACASGQRQPGFNVVQITYDSYQLHDMATALRRKGAAWVSEFPQTTERLIADGQLHKLALKRQLAHNGDPELREHVMNAKAKLQSDEESRMRIVKRGPNHKVDLVVAASMGVKRVLELNV
jgi:hypothetical protein